jgi:hypothetical protein
MCARQLPAAAADALPPGSLKSRVGEGVLPVLRAPLRLDVTSAPRLPARVPRCSRWTSRGCWRGWRLKPPGRACGASGCGCRPAEACGGEKCRSIPHSGGRVWGTRVCVRHRAACWSPCSPPRHTFRRAQGLARRTDCVRRWICRAAHELAPRCRTSRRVTGRRWWGQGIAVAIGCGNPGTAAASPSSLGSPSSMPSGRATPAASGVSAIAFVAEHSRAMNHAVHAYARLLNNGGQTMPCSAGNPLRTARAQADFHSG